MVPHRLELHHHTGVAPIVASWWRRYAGTLADQVVRAAHTAVGARIVAAAAAVVSVSFVCVCRARNVAMGCVAAQVDAGAW